MGGLGEKDFVRTDFFQGLILNINKESKLSFIYPLGLEKGHGT